MALLKNDSAERRRESNIIRDDLLSNYQSDLDDLTWLGTDNSDLYDSYYNYFTGLDDYDNNWLWSNYESADNILDLYIDDETTTRSDALQDYFDSLFAGYGTTDYWQNSLWSMDADNTFNENYLSSYYDDALARIDAAQARGLLTDAGYDSAISTLDTRNSAASGEINDLTDAVISNNLDDFSDLGAGMQTAIDEYDLSDRDAYNTDTYTDQFSSLYDQQQSSFENDLNSAVAGYTPYDVADILATARSTQGVLSGNENTELLASLEASDADSTKKIGLTNQGIF